LETTIFTEDAGEAEQADVRSSGTLWRQPPARDIRPIAPKFNCEVLVVGAGITGALVAERLTREERHVVLIDREDPGRGSTAASTAMILWEIDCSLSQLTELYGIDHASRDYHASFTAAQRLQSFVAEHQLPCFMRPKPSLFLATGENDRQLRQEFEIRRRVGLPVEYLDYKTLLSTFEIARAGAILSSGAADVDPVRLTHALLDLSRSRGAELFHANAVDFDGSGSRVFVRLDHGEEIEAQHVVLATGYVMPEIVSPTIHSVASSWAIATRPQPQNIWKGGALIWEDSEDYNYARTTVDGRIVFGGEDDEGIIKPNERDAAIPGKTAALGRKLRVLWPKASIDIEYRWAGTFDTTQDGLPLIGRVPGHSNIFAAYGYGGNGITFSCLAAELIAALIAGGNSPLLDDFAIDR
jgi:glycine/D-amino acid oxidase-like deaminating enzyme